MSVPNGNSYIGKYRIIEKVAEGGMCYIFLGKKPRNQPVAVKQLAPRYQKDIELRRRFMREARYALQLNHRHIVDCVDVGDDPTGSYIVYEWMDGGDLEDFVRTNGTLTEYTAVKLMACIVEALGYAHENNLLHRDIKPENIMLSNAGIPKLADFGLAKPITPSGLMKITKFGQVIGSPHYMSPEQIEGKTLSPATDFYGMGATLFFLVTGRPPYLGTDYEVIFNQLNEPVPNPRDFTRRRLSTRFVRMITKMLAKSPADRPQSAGEIFAELTSLKKPPPSNTSTIFFKPSSGSSLFRAEEFTAQPHVVESTVPDVRIFRRQLPRAGKAGVLVLEGSASRKRRVIFLYQKPEILMGRLPGEPNDICLCLFPIKERLQDTSRISRMHIRLQWDGKQGLWFVSDNRSRNGLLVENLHLKGRTSIPIKQTLRLVIPETLKLTVKPLKSVDAPAAIHPHILPVPPRNISPFGCDRKLPRDGLLIRRHENAEHHYYVALQRRLLVGGVGCARGLSLPIRGWPDICFDILLYRGYFLLRNLAVPVTVETDTLPSGEAVLLSDGLKGTIFGIPFSYHKISWHDYQAW